MTIETHQYNDSDQESDSTFQIIQFGTLLEQISDARERETANADLAKLLEIMPSELYDIFISTMIDVLRNKPGSDNTDIIFELFVRFRNIYPNE